MKEEKKLWEIAYEIAVIFTVICWLLSPFAMVLARYFIKPHTHTTMHQPEPTGLYADSLVCPD